MRTDLDCLDCSGASTRQAVYACKTVTTVGMTCNGLCRGDTCHSHAPDTGQWVPSTASGARGKPTAAAPPPHPPLGCILLGGRSAPSAFSLMLIHVEEEAFYMLLPANKYDCCLMCITAYIILEWHAIALIGLQLRSGSCPGQLVS